jgi:hypothetical protein
MRRMCVLKALFKLNHEEIILSLKHMTLIRDLNTGTLCDYGKTNVHLKDSGNDSNIISEITF